MIMFRIEFGGPMQSQLQVFALGNQKMHSGPILGAPPEPPHLHGDGGGDPTPTPLTFFVGLWPPHQLVNPSQKQ